VLVISAHAASWLQARPDDKVVDYFLRKGESASITFSKTLSVKFGNAGGVKLELDGKPYPFQAASGEVKTLVVQ
jgi:cytoskeleton protein RodZ